MPERLCLREVGFTMRNVGTRMPFRYGVATLTSVPILHVRAEVELADGTRARGLAADILPPKWFDKDPAKSYEENVDDLLFAARQAARAFAEASREPRPVFDIWRDGYAEALRAGDRRGLDHLTASHGSTLMERALIDAVGRAAGRSYHQLLTDPANPLGLDLGAVLPVLAGTPPSAAVAPRSSESIAVRHTVGLADPIRDADVPAGEKLDDGLPQSLEAYLAVQGIRWAQGQGQRRPRGRPRAAHRHRGSPRRGTGRRRLRALPRRQRAVRGARWLRGAAGAHRAGPARLRRRHRLRGGGQPLERSVALDEEQAAGIASVSARKPMIIDESDGDLDSFERAAELGYRGVSTKNCKGLFKALANAALARAVERRAGRPLPHHRRGPDEPSRRPPAPGPGPRGRPGAGPRRAQRPPLRARPRPPVAAGAGDGPARARGPLPALRGERVPPRRRRSHRRALPAALPRPRRRERLRSRRHGPPRGLALRESAMTAPLTPGAEAVARLQEMLRFDTTNPPGNELPLVRHLAAELAAEGLEPQVLEAGPERASLAVRLRGDGSERPLLLMSHLDVVPAEPERWSHPPFGGEIAAGVLYGRGSIDSKLHRRRAPAGPAHVPPAQAAPEARPGGHRRRRRGARAE